MYASVWKLVHASFLLLLVCAGIVTLCDGASESPKQQHNTEACAILYTQIEDDKDPLHIMFLINECMATLTTELPNVQSADKEDYDAIVKYAKTFSDLVTSLRDYGNDVQGHFGGKKIQVGENQYESLAARTHNEFVGRVDKEMASLHSWMKDTWPEEPILDWAGQEVKHEWVEDEEGEGFHSKVFEGADVDTLSKKQHDYNKIGISREELLDKAKQRGWGKSHFKKDALTLDAYKNAHNLQNHFQDMVAGDYQVSSDGCKNVDAAKTNLGLATPGTNALCPSVRLHYAGEQQNPDVYTFTVTNKGMSSAIEKSKVNLPKAIKNYLSDQTPIYKIGGTCQDPWKETLLVDERGKCEDVRLEWAGPGRTTDAYSFKVVRSGGGDFRQGELVELPIVIRTQLQEAKV